MAATTQIAAPATRSLSPIAVWHLCSLDAPTVAALWTFFLARASHVRLPVAAPVAMAIAVWILYAADRILDARRIGHPNSDLEARHFFHHRHRRVFLTGSTLAAAALAALLPSLSPSALRLYLVEGVLLVAWFSVLHLTPNSHRLPKEIAVGVFFSAAVFIPTIARAPSLRPTLLPGALLFAALCTLNCLCIDAWEHEPPRTTARLTNIPTFAILIAIAAATLALLHPSTPKPIPAAITLATLLLLILHRNRRRISRTHLRAAADLALLTPILLLPFLR